MAELPDHPFCALKGCHSRSVDVVSYNGVMRKISDPEAHLARTDILEGRYPEGMSARCSWCGEVRPVIEGDFVPVKGWGTGPSRAFKCSGCERDSAA